MDFLIPHSNKELDYVVIRTSISGLQSPENIPLGNRADESHYEVVKNKAYGIVQ